MGSTSRLLVLALFVFPTLANDSPSIAERFAARYRAANTLQANFLERYFENGALVRAESGIAYFRKPGRMRWEYEMP